MIFITLVERVVKRCDDVTHPNLHHVTKMTQRTVDSYLADIVPRVGEVIRLDDTLPAYTVQAVIYSKSSAANYDCVCLEVTPYGPDRIHDTGTYSFHEEWPLIMDLEKEPMN